MFRAEKFFHNKFNHLLVVLITIFLALPFAGKENFDFPILSFVFFSALLAVLKSFIKKNNVFFCYIGVALCAFIFDVLQRSELFPNLNTPHLISSMVLHAVFLSMVIVLLLKELFTTREVTADAIKGGVCIYLLLGILWGFFYAIINQFDAGAFTKELLNGNEVFYFSFSTLTTVGYGDITPVNAVAKIFANLEAVAGQLYVGVFIARLVGLYIVKELKHEN